MENIDEFSLKWNYFQSNLATGLHDLLQEETMVDVTLAAEGKILHAHKIILSVCSPYFKDLFRVNPCQHPIVILKDVGHREMADMLEFMYRGEASVRVEDLPAFFRLAETLKVKGLAGDKQEEDPTPSPLSQSAPQVPEKKKVVDDDHDPGEGECSSGGEPQRKKRKATRTESAMPFPSSSSAQSFPMAGLKQEMPEPLAESEETSEHLVQLTAEQGMEQERDFDHPDSDDWLEQPAGCSHQMDFGMSPCPWDPDPRVPDPFKYSFTLTRKGRPKLLHLGYEYTSTSMRVSLGRQTYWRCTEYKKFGCRARAILRTTGLTVRGVHSHKATFAQYLFRA